MIPKPLRNVRFILIPTLGSKIFLNLAGASCDDLVPVCA